MIKHLSKIEGEPRCWFCDRILTKKPGVQVCKFDKRKTSVSVESLEPEMGEYPCWASTNLDETRYIDKKLPTLISKSDINSYVEDDRFIPVGHYSYINSLFIVDGEIGKLNNSVVIIESLFDSRRYYLETLNEWNDRDTKKKYVLTRKDIKQVKLLLEEC